MLSYAGGQDNRYQRKARMLQIISQPVAPTSHLSTIRLNFPGCYLFAYPSNHSIFKCGVFRAACMRIAILIASDVYIKH